MSAGNRWTITAFNDESPNHDQWATQGLCFRSIGFFGTHQRYEWWSDTFPDWNGIASQEGNEVVLHGDYANDVGHDAVFFNVVSSTPRNVGAGKWVEWREDSKFGRTIGFANALLNRVGPSSSRRRSRSKAQTTSGRGQRGVVLGGESARMSRPRRSFFVLAIGDALSAVSSPVGPA